MPLTIKRSAINIKNSDGYNASDVFFGGDIDTTINLWLNNHPEATTTVEDGAITEIKLNSSLRIKKPNFYSDINGMIDDSNLISGMFAVTFGYNSDGDGGGSAYSIREFASGETADGGSVIELENGLAAECITETIPYPEYIRRGNIAKLYGIVENSDITSQIQNTIALNNVDVIEVPDGNYVISETIQIPDNTSLILSGDYKDENLPQTIITTTTNGLTMFSLGSGSHLIGGYICLAAAENVKVVEIDIFNKGVSFTTVEKTKIVGGRESDRVLSQTAIYIECDDPDEQITEHGYLMHCLFDARIETVGYAYHFHRQRAGNTSSGVWLTENNIYGYIRHCTRYVFYDFAQSGYANNNSIIGATIQAGSKITGESNYPGINLKGTGISITGQMWDFDSSHQYPAILFDSGASSCISYGTQAATHSGGNTSIDNNLTRGRLLRETAFRKVSVTSNESAVENGYISDLTSYSYRVGQVVYLKCDFKILTTVPSGTVLFKINEDAFNHQSVANVLKNADGSVVGRVIIGSNSTHNVTTQTNITGSNAWVSIDCIALLNAISDN